MQPPPGEPTALDAYMPPVRPRSVTVVAILGIIFGALGCTCILGSVALSLAMGNAQEQAAQMPSELMTFGVITGIAGVVLSIVLLIGSIGALRLRPWARSMLLAFAAVDLMYDVGKLVLNLIWFVPRMEPVWRNSPQFRSNPNMNVEQGVRIARAIANGMSVATAAVTIAFALIVLIVMARPHVKLAFESQAGAPM
jgi:hypothetical protein